VHLPNPLQGKATQSAINPHPALHYEDCNIVLLSTPSDTSITALKVDKTLLARASPVFAGMFFFFPLPKRWNYIMEYLLFMYNMNPKLRGDF